MKMKTDDFTAVGTIETVFAPAFQLRDGREVASVGFALITEDHRRFECQTDDSVAALPVQGRFHCHSENVDTEVKESPKVKVSSPRNK